MVLEQVAHLPLKGNESAKACPVLLLRGATFFVVSFLHFLENQRGLPDVHIMPPVNAQTWRSAQPLLLRSEGRWKRIPTYDLICHCDCLRTK